MPVCSLQYQITELPLFWLLCLFRISTFGTEQIQHLWSDFHALAAFSLEVQPTLDPDDGLKHVSFHAVSLLRLDACHGSLTTAFETGMDKQLKSIQCSGIWQCQSRKPQYPQESPLQIQTPLAQLLCNSFWYCCSSVRLLSWSKCWRGRLLNGMRSV